MVKVSFRALSFLVALVATVVPRVTAAAGPAAAADTATTDTFVALYGAPGSYVMASQDLLLQPSATQTVSAEGSSSSVEVAALGDHHYDLEFDAPSGQVLTTGYYPNAVRLGQTAGHPGIDVSGDGRGCNSTTGQFIVSDIAFSGGTLARFAASFVMHCESPTDGLMGEVRYHEPTTTALVVEAASLLFPPQFVGVANSAVPVLVTNPTAGPIAVGTPAVAGPGAADVVVSADTCPPLLGADASCAITLTVTPGGAGWRQSIVTVASSPVGITDPGIAGNAAFVLDSEPGEAILNGQQLVFTQSNSTIYSAGDPSNSVTLKVVNTTSSYTATLGAPAGHNLAVGTYQNASFAPGHPSVDIYGNDGPLCSAPTGQFTVRQIAFDRAGNLTQFAADAQMQCGGTTTLFAGLRFASALGYSAVSVAPGSGQLAYPDQAVYRTSATQAVTVTNTGIVAVTESATVGGTDTDDFRLTSSTCATLSPLAPGASCTSTITFTPHGIGPRSAVLILSDSTARGRRFVALNGTGTGPVAFTYPIGDHLSLVDTTKAFTWAALPQVQAYDLVIGTTAGAADLVDSGVVPATHTQLSVPALPAGVLLYSTLFTEVAGHWDHYQTITFGVMVQRALLYLPGTLVSATAPLQWTTNSQDQAYYLVVGTTPGGLDVVNSGVLPPSQASFSHPPFPAHTTLYATIFTEWVGHWDSYETTTFTTPG